MPARKIGPWLLVLLIALVVWFVRQPGEGPPAGGPPDSGDTPPSDSGETPDSGLAGEQEILDAFEDGESDLWVQVPGTVDRLLSDDTNPPRHQRFVMALSSGHTLLVSHNIDLAPRIDALERGDGVLVRGEYEWNDRGGVVHWTHHDPQGRIDGGWIEHEGRKYR